MSRSNSEKARRLREKMFRGLLWIPCAHCGERLYPYDATIDHIVPASKGGRLALVNVAIACRQCNMKRGARDFWRYRAMRQRTRLLSRVLR